MNAAIQVLQRYWRFLDFREAQKPILEAVLSDTDLLALLPTGGGKSVTFQVPALLKPGMTLVITPLVALMENQTAQLKELGIPAACLHSQQTAEQRRTTLAGIVQKRWKLLYLSPESLLSPPVWERLQQCVVHRIVLDEAHCLTSWGSSFRPDYHRIGAVRRALGHPPLCAFTATATPKTQQALVNLLGLQAPKILANSPYRSNLHLQVRQIWYPQQRLKEIQRFLATRTQETGLIYLRTRQGTEKLADHLRALGLNTAAYHAGLGAGQRRDIENRWLGGDLKFLCSTNAFGMGIDKPNVRWVIHGNTPLDLAEYVQEIGRAGRDGQPARVLLLASEPTGWLDPTDRDLHRHFRQQYLEQRKKAQQQLTLLPKTGKYRSQDALSLAILHEQGQLHWQTPFDYLLNTQTFLASTVQCSDTMKHYIYFHGCRWQFLQTAFGWPKQSACGHCDFCCPSTAS
jgi:ATP-dependent DNA helicase RecQ